MGQYLVKNASLQATVGTLGAELLSLRGSDGIEQIWCGDPGVWGRQGPTIFPILGGWAKGYYLYEGKQYVMDKNGFARSAEFKVVRQEEDLVELELTDNENTQKQYPFAFQIRTCYRAIDHKLVVTQTLENLSSEYMPAALGLHPGFAWDRKEEGAYVRFSCPQTLRAFHPDGKW